MSERTRRRFLTEAGAAVAGGVCMCSLGGCKMITGKGDTPEIPPGAYLIETGKLNLNLTQVPSLAQVGGSVKITDANLPEPIIVAHVGEREFVAVSLKCTHGGRELEYDSAGKKFRCVSFGHSEFGFDGAVIKGPAEKPLKFYPASLGFFDRNKLTIKLS